MNGSKSQRALYIGVMFACLAAAVVLAGCAPRYLSKTPDNALRYPYISVLPEELAAFRVQITSKPKDPQSAQAYFWVGQDAFNRLDWETASAHFSQIYKHFPFNEWAPLARWMDARARVKLKNAPLALSLLYPLVKSKTKYSPALQDAALLLGRDILNDELTLDELLKVESAYPETPWPAQALFVMGKRTLDAGNLDQAVKLFRRFLEIYPEHELAPRAQELIEKSVQLVPVNRFKIGCLLPLTGPYAPFGKAIKQGLDLALGQANAQRPSSEILSITVADSEANTNQAVTELHRLAEVEKVFFVLGPVLSVSARSILPELEKIRIPVITPSASEPDLTGKSPYFFRYLLTNEQQGEAMAEWMILRQGFRRLGILYSQSRYDRSLADAFVKKAQALGAEIVAQAEFPIGTRDFEEYMQALGGVDPGPLKNRELEERKDLDRIVDNFSQQAAQALAPAAQAVLPNSKATAATPFPSKRVAIVRFTEEGIQASSEQLGKKICERFSYSLAVRPGLEVLTQKQTLDTLRKLQLSPLSIGREGVKQLGDALNVHYVVQGSVTQKDNVARNPPVPGRPLPVIYDLEIRVFNAHSGQEVLADSKKWVKMIAPDANVRAMEALYLPVAIEDAVLIVPQLAFYDLNVKVFGPDAWISPRLYREGADILNGAVLATGFWLDNPDPVSQNFVKSFQEAYSSQPSVLAAQAYDTLQLAASVMAKVPSDAVTRESFISQLQKETDFLGVTGKAWVEPNGEIRRKPFFLSWEQGTLKRIE